MNHNLTVGDLMSEQEYKHTVNSNGLKATDQQILVALKTHDWNRANAAKEVGITRQRMFQRVMKLKLEGHKIPDSKKGRRKRNESNT